MFVVLYFCLPAAAAFTQFPFSFCVYLSFSGTGCRVLGRVFPPLESRTQLVQSNAVHSLTNDYHVIVSCPFSGSFTLAPADTMTVALVRLLSLLISVQLVIKKIQRSQMNRKYHYFCIGTNSYDVISILRRSVCFCYLLTEFY